MNIAESFQVKIVSTPEFIRAVESEAKANPEKMKVLSSGREKDPSFLEFGLVEVAAIVTTVTGVFYLIELGSKIFKWIKEDKAKRVVIQTPRRRVEIVATEDLTESEVQEILRRSIEIAT